MRAKSFTPRRSRTSVLFSLPSPRLSGHSMCSVGNGMATALLDNTSSIDQYELGGSRSFPDLPAWSLTRIGNRDRYAVAQNQRDGSPAIMHVQLCPALSESDQALVVYAVELCERRQVFDRFTRDPHWLCRDVNLDWSHPLFPPSAQETGISRIDGNRLPMSVACRVELPLEQFVLASN